MPEINEKSRILAIIRNANLLNKVGNSLKDEADFDFIEQSTFEDGVQHAIAWLKPNIVLIDFDEKAADTYNITDIIAAKFPDIAIVVVLQESEPNISDRVRLSGARDFILFPIAKEKLLVTLRRIVESLKRNLPGSISQKKDLAIPEKPKNTFTVFSPKGGTGCTTIAINLAIALRKLLKEPVLLVDGKFTFGHIALMLNIRATNSITDLISHASRLDKQLIDQVVVEHASGIKVLTSPGDATEAQGIHAEALYKVLTELQATFPAIIIDGGNYLNENTITLMDASEKIIVVMNPNLASIKDVRQFIDICQTLSYPTEKTVLVLNNSGHRTDIRHDEIEKILKRKITCEIYGDDKTFPVSLNEGVPVILRYPHHQASKAMGKLAATLMNKAA